MYQPIGTPPVCVEVVVTGENGEWLADFTHTVIAARLAACGQTIAPVHAVYHRDGEVTDVTQARVCLHTRAALVPEIVDRVNGEHPDGMTTVVATQLVDGSPEYLQWIVDETIDGAIHSVTSAGRRQRQDEGHRFWARAR